MAIREFMESFQQQHHVDFTAKTTADVLPIVKDLTRLGMKGESYCEYLERVHSNASNIIGDATVFVSHAWKYKFCDFVACLEERFASEPENTYFWIDIFSHNQHNELTSEEWITAFEQHIVRINRTVMILSPWNNPTPLKRSPLILMNTASVYPFYLIELGACLKCFIQRKMTSILRFIFEKRRERSFLKLYREIKKKPCLPSGICRLRRASAGS